MPDQTRNLNSVTDFAGTLDSNDRIIMTDNKASLKALTTAILGKAIIEGYTGSSLAGASRSVKAAVDSLDSKLSPLLGYDQKAGLTDLNNAKAAGTYVYMSSCANIPSGNYGYVQVIPSNSAGTGMVYQIAVDRLNNMFIRYSDGNTWGAWEILNGKTSILDSAVLTPATGITITSNGRYSHKCNNVATITFSVKKTDESAFSGNRIDIGTLATGWRPASNVVFPVGGNATIGGYVNVLVGNCMIRSNGNVSIDITDSNAKNIEISFTYIIA